MAKVLILAGDAAEDLETMFVKYRLLEAGHEPYVTAPTTRPISSSSTTSSRSSTRTSRSRGEPARSISRSPTSIRLCSRPS